MAVGPQRLSRQPNTSLMSGSNPTIDLTTVSDVQAWMTALSVPVIPGPQLQQMVTAMSAAIANWLGYNPIQAAYDQTFDGRGTAKVAFPNIPVTAVSSLTIDGMTIQQSTVSPWMPGYVFNTVQGQSWLGLRGCRFWRGMQNCEVQYTAGYTSGNIPPALVEACREAITALSQVTAREPGLTKEKVGGLEEDYAAPTSATTAVNGFVLTPTITLALMPLRRVAPAW